MATLAFTKGHAAGRDFILVADPDGAIDLTPERVQRLCDRRTGIGADGVIRVVRSTAIDEGTDVLIEDPEAVWFMDLRRADGSAPPMCADGIRVFAHFLIAEGYAAPERRELLPIGTRAGVRDVLAGVSGYTVDLGRWRLAPERLVAARGLDVARPGLGVQIGGEHIVTVLAHEGELAALELERAPHLDPEPLSAADIEFVIPEDPLVQNAVAHIGMRVHMHGIGETPASGEGAAAAALAFRHWGGEGMPHHWSVDASGGRLAVRMFPTEEGEHVSLSGPTALRFHGSIALD